MNYLKSLVLLNTISMAATFNYHFIGIAKKFTNHFQTKSNSFRDNYDEYMPEWLLNRCEDLGFISPTEVQKSSLGLIFEGKDVVLQGQTGFIYSSSCTFE